ncbi:MAG: stage II sporulation protein M [Acidobacteria bacterium]|nr:stage II sporulation protein M [Acidobacteriota bacterium]MCH8128434.1 stage II sporulation protein M [Acidobacteriota bacterium]MCH8991575.1 stage II sporulation protein M [Acidobacteriota bacterium]
MNLERFLSSNEAGWTELEQLVDAAGSRPASLGGSRLRRMGGLYRQTAADLAQARRLFPSDPVVGRLESLVMRSRALVYTDRSRSVNLTGFYRTRYWQLLVERRVILAIATALLLVPAVIGWVVAMTDPAAAASIVPGAFLWVAETQPQGTDQGLAADQLAGLSAFILVNNVRVTLVAFAGGILWGFGTIFIMIFNGVILGTVGGLAVGAGNTALFVEAIAAHGLLELSCIVAGAVAGLRLASGLIRPGHQTRRKALIAEAGPAVQLALGTIPFLVVAAVVEEFVSRTGTTAGPAVLIGVFLGGGYWVLAVVLGKSEGSDRLGLQIGSDAGAAERLV